MPAVRVLLVAMLTMALLFLMALGAEAKCLWALPGLF
jgi:hypothetical protein